MKLTIKQSGSLGQELEKQIRYATAVALTRTAQKIESNLEREMAGVFDRPTPYTLSAFAVRPATKDNLTAEVRSRDFPKSAARVLDPEVEGGPRLLKPFEEALLAAGVLPDGLFAVPGDAADLDQYGNINPGQITAMLSALRASRDATQNRGDGRGRGSRADEIYFVGGTTGRAATLPPGVYKRAADGRLAIVLAFVKQPEYQHRLDVQKVAERTIADTLPGAFETALEQALKTAR